MIRLVADRQLAVPPEDMRNHKDQELYFRSAEAVFNQYICKYFDLKPEYRVLDVGCAAGRLALPLVRFLDPELGSYDGFDIRKDRIDWATNTITSQHPNFRFSYLDVNNRFLNPAGGVDGGELTLPYPDRHFDLVIYHSVFTHLDDKVAANYLQESARVLSDRGAIYATFYIWDAETASCVSHNDTLWRFPHDLGAFRVEDTEKVEKAVAFKHSWLVAKLAEAGLSIKNVARGEWRNAKNQGQDVYVFQRDRATTMLSPGLS